MQICFSLLLVFLRPSPYNFSVMDKTNQLNYKKQEKLHSRYSAQYYGKIKMLKTLIQL